MPAATCMEQPLVVPECLVLCAHLCIADPRLLEEQFRRADRMASGVIAVQELPVLMIRLGASAPYAELRERITASLPQQLNTVNWFDLMNALTANWQPETVPTHTRATNPPNQHDGSDIADAAMHREPAWAVKAWRVAEKIVAALCGIPNFHAASWLRALENSLREAANPSQSSTRSVVSQADFWQCLKNAGVDLSLSDKEQLWKWIRLDAPSIEHSTAWASRSMPRLCLYSEITAWFRNQIQHNPWLLQDSDKLFRIQRKLLPALGPTLKQRRRFVAALRRKFASIVARASSATGKDSGSSELNCIPPGAFLSVLKDAGLNLTVAEEASLLDVMEALKLPRSDSILDDGPARVPYAAFLDICSKVRQ